MRGRLAERPVIASPPPLAIRCLGTFAIERDGEPISLPPLRPLPRALLLLLALTTAATSIAK